MSKRKTWTFAGDYIISVYSPAHGIWYVSGAVKNLGPFGSKVEAMSEARKMRALVLEALQELKLEWVDE